MTDTPLVERLRGLVERLEKLEGPDRAIDAEIDSLAMWGPHSDWENAGGGYERHKATGEQRSFDLWSRGTPAFTDSLDAAVALVERVLPGWSYSIQRQGHGNLGPFSIARVARANEADCGVEGYDAIHDHLAIALVIAALRALSQEQSHEQ